MQAFYPLRPALQHYDWGGFQYIPELLHIDNHQQKPYAELWLGTHPKGMAQVKSGAEWMSLQTWINEQPTAILGSRVAKRFQQKLPFLLKVLDVRQMLSIQAHPDKATAERGFREEEEQGIPQDAPNRTFRDNNHKPETMVALSDFWLLHGFRQSKEIQNTLREIPGWHTLESRSLDGGIKGLYRHIMEMDQTDVDQYLKPLAEWLALQSYSLSDKNHPHYWAKQAFQTYDRKGHLDRGIFSIYWLNLVKLTPGQGIFQASGVPHAYLEGQNVELMANSDNVFRGGLTHKHMDVPALLSNLRFEPVRPDLLSGILQDDEWVYPSPVADFVLSRVSLSANKSVMLKQTDAPAIYIILEGEVNTHSPEKRFRRGETFLVPAQQQVSLTALQEAQLFKASVPDL